MAGQPSGRGCSSATCCSGSTGSHSPGRRTSPSWWRAWARDDDPRDLRWRASRAGGAVRRRPAAQDRREATRRAGGRRRAGGERGRGTMIRGISDGGPAERAGLFVGDLLLRIDGKPLAGPEDVAELVASVGAG